MVDARMKSTQSIRVMLLLAILTLMTAGCHRDPEVAPDTHHYTPEEARAAFQQHMQTAPPKGTPGNAAQAGAGNQPRNQ
jgi:hypothetical protein